MNKRQETFNFFLHSFVIYLLNLTIIWVEKKSSLFQGLGVKPISTSVFGDVHVSSSARLTLYSFLVCLTNLFWFILSLCSLGCQMVKSYRPSLETGWINDTGKEKEHQYRNLERTDLVLNRSSHVSSERN